MLMKFPISDNGHLNGIIGVAMQVHPGCRLSSSKQPRALGQNAMEQMRNIRLASESSELMGTSKNQYLFCLQVISISPFLEAGSSPAFFFFSFYLEKNKPKHVSWGLTLLQ